MDYINKITNIRIEENSQMKVFFKKHTMRPLVLTIKHGFWNRTKFKGAKPLDIGRTFGGEDKVLFPLWVDELGERYEDEICERLTDFCKTNIEKENE